MRTGGQILVDLLAAEGVRHVFTVPGESFLDVLDAMHGRADITPIVTRNESGAAMMAEATGKLTGQAGVALVTRGPGAANALAGVYIAHIDRSPMLLIVGLPPRSKLALPRFQDVDVEALFGSLVRFSAVAAEAASLPLLLARALAATQSGGGGPAVLGIPEDVFAEAASVAKSAVERPISAAPAEGDVKRLRTFLAHAKRPLVIAGSARWSVAASQALARFAEQYDLPVVTAFRRQDRFDNRHRCYAGHLGFGADAKLQAGICSADLIISIGDGLDAVTTAGYELIAAPRPAQLLVAIASSDEMVKSVLAPAHHIAWSTGDFVRAIAAIEPPARIAPWGEWRRDLRSAYLGTLDPRVINPGAPPGGVNLDQVVQHLSNTLSDEAIVCNGAGNYAAVLHRAFVYKSWPTELAPRAGSMGYGLPAAIAAKLIHPDRTVVALAGDGCFQMTGQELATAVQFGLPVIIIVANNCSLGTIRMHQQRRFPNRTVATSLLNPDFAKLAESHGALGQRVTDTKAFPEVLAAARRATVPSVIELVLDPDSLTEPASGADEPR